MWIFVSPILGITRFRSQAMRHKKQKNVNKKMVTGGNWFRFVNTTWSIAQSWACKYDEGSMGIFCTSQVIYN